MVFQVQRATAPPGWFNTGASSLSWPAIHHVPIGAHLTNRSILSPTGGSEGSQMRRHRQSRVDRSKAKPHGKVVCAKTPVSRRITTARQAVERRMLFIGEPGSSLELINARRGLREGPARKPTTAAVAPSISVAAEPRSNRIASNSSGRLACSECLMSARRGRSGSRRRTGSSHLGRHQQLARLSCNGTPLRL